jgi:hypothetical protein
MKEVTIKIIDTFYKLEDIELEFKKSFELGFQWIGEFGKYGRYQVFKKEVKNEE